MSDRGRLVFVSGQGVLFRAGADEELRRHLLTNDLVEAVIGLPEGMLAATNIPGALLLLNKSKAKRRRQRVLFVDGRAFNDPDSRVDRITATYREFADVPGAARVVSAEEIAGYSNALTIARYVQPVIETRSVSLTELAAAVAKHESSRDAAARRMDALVSELVSPRRSRSRRRQ
jgi:type I restriction enzyme M protein